MSIHCDKRGYWVVKYRDSKGQQHSRSFGKGVQAKKDAMEFDLSSNKESFSGSYTLSKLLPDFVSHLRLHNRSPEYIETMESLVHRSGIEDVPIKQLTASSFSSFEELHPVTRNRYLSYLKVILNWAVNENLIPDSPLARWKKQKEHPRQSKLSLEDLKKISRHSPPHLKWVIKIALSTGVRAGEIGKLKWDDVDFENRVLNISEPLKKSYRSVPLSKDFYKELVKRKASANSEYLVTYRGKPVYSFRKSFNSACVKAGIKYKCEMYDIRHLSATTMLRRGGDLKSVSEMLGHRSTRMTTDVYYHALSQEKRRAIDLIPSL